MFHITVQLAPGDCLTYQYATILHVVLVQLRRLFPFLAVIGPPPFNIALGQIAVRSDPIHIDPLIPDDDEAINAIGKFRFRLHLPLLNPHPPAPAQVIEAVRQLLVSLLGIGILPPPGVRIEPIEVVAIPEAGEGA